MEGAGMSGGGHKRSMEKVGGPQAEVRVKAVNSFMEKRGTWANQGLVGSFMGAERQLWVQ